MAAASVCLLRAFIVALLAVCGLCQERPKRVLITGVTGMIGSHVAEHLCSVGGYEVHGLLRWRSSTRNLRRVADNITLHYGDITDAGSMHRLITKLHPDYIYHLAAQAYNGPSWDSPQYTLDANIQGTLNILEPLRANDWKDVRVLLAASSAGYGKTTDEYKGKPVPETAKLQPMSPYGVSKAAGELLAQQYFYSYGIQVVIARLFVHIGTGHTENQAIQTFCLQVAEMEAGLRPPVLKVGRLDTRRDMTDIRDSAPVIVKLAEKGKVPEPYNVASGKTISMRDLVDIVLANARIKGIEVRTDPARLRAADEAVLLGDNTKIRKLTGWVPKTDMTSSVISILNYWRGEVRGRKPVRTARRSTRSSTRFEEDN